MEAQLEVGSLGHPFELHASNPTYTIIHSGTIWLYIVRNACVKLFDTEIILYYKSGLKIYNVETQLLPTKTNDTAV